MFNPVAFPNSSKDRIELCQPSEVVYWCDLLRCTEQELRAAVYAVGGQPEQVTAYFDRSFRQKLVNTWHRMRR